MLMCFWLMRHKLYTVKQLKSILRIPVNCVTKVIMRWPFLSREEQVFRPYLTIVFQKERLRCSAKRPLRSESDFQSRPHSVTFSALNQISPALLSPPSLPMWGNLIKEKTALAADRYEFKVSVVLSKSHRVSESKGNIQQPGCSSFGLWKIVQITSTVWYREEHNHRALTFSFSFSLGMAESLITWNPLQLPSLEPKQVIQSLKQASTNACQHP